MAAVKIKNTSWGSRRPLNHGNRRWLWWGEIALEIWKFWNFA